MTRPGEPAASALRVTGSSRRSGRAGVGGHHMGIASRPELRRRCLRARAGLCGARSRHQQLPPPDRAPDRRELPRHRRVLPHHPARRGHLGDRPHQRSGHRPRGRRARHLPRQDAQPRRHPRAADRDRGLPRCGQRQRVPRPHRRGGRPRTRDHRPRNRGDARRHRLHAAGRSAGRGRGAVRHRRRLLGNRPARPLRADAGAARRCRRSGAGPRCRSAW